MSFGGKFVNNNNTIVIDQDYQNLSIVQTGSINANRDGSASISYKGNTPLLCVVPNGGSTIAVVNKRSQDGTMTFNFFGEGSCRWAIFDIGAGSGDRWGFRVFNGNGAVVFDSGRHYMRVVDVITSDRLTGNGYGIPGGRTYGYIACGPSFVVETDWSDDDGAAALIISDVAFSASGNGMIWYRAYQQTGYSGYRYPDFVHVDLNTSNPYLVIDMTGYI